MNVDVLAGRQRTDRAVGVGAGLVESAEQAIEQLAKVRVRLRRIGCGAARQGAVQLPGFDRSICIDDLLSPSDFQ